MKVRVVWKPGGWLSPHVAQADAPPQALVDLRSHILWGVEDGPLDLGHSIAMIKVAAHHGTTDIVATPRASFEHRFNPRMIAQRVAELRSRCDGFIRIHAGCDFHFSPTNIRDALADPHKYTIAGRSHLIVEFADVVVPPATEEILLKFRAKGIIPIISHP